MNTGTVQLKTALAAAVGGDQLVLSMLTNRIYNNLPSVRAPLPSSFYTDLELGL
jgi:hypothetical protein